MNIKETIKNGKGVFAEKAYEQDEVIAMLEGTLQEQASRYSIQLSENLHLDIPPEKENSEKDRFAWHLMNHHCEPNCFIDVKERLVKTKREIREGEELCFDYNTTEYELATPFRCRCDSSRCYGSIKGYKHLSRIQKAKIKRFTAPHLLYDQKEELIAY